MDHTTHNQSKEQYAHLKEKPRTKAGGEARKKILKEPEERWVAPHDHHEGLSYTIHSWIVPGEEAQVRSILQGNQFVDMGAASRSALSVIHSPLATRVEIQGKSAFGSECVFIKDDKQGMLFLDKESKTYVHIPTELSINSYYKEKFRGRVTVDDEHGRTVARVTIDAPYRIKYELTLDTNERYRPFAEKVACSVIGCADKFQAAGLDLSAISSRGIPVSGKTFIAQGKGDFRPITSFELQDIRLEHANPELFAVPHDYKDLRHRQSDHAEKHTSLFPARKLSDLRQNTMRPAGSANPVATDNICVACDTAPGYTSYANSSDDTVGQTSSALTLSQNERGMPRCFSDETYGSLIANLVDQKLLDDVKYLVNGVSRRLSGFSGSGGTIPIDWMTQFKAFADALGDSDEGGGLYVMLHDEDAIDAGHPQKLGLLDKLAAVNLANLLASGDNLASLSLDPALQAAVNAVLANAAIAAADKFSNLTGAQQGQLIDAYVFNGIGTLNLTYPTSTGTQQIFHNLLNVRLDDIAFDVDINNTSIVDTLAFDGSGIHLVIKLPDASGQAFMTRWPSDTYWAALAISGIACLFLPFLCSLAVFVAAVGVFLLTDLAFLAVQLSNIEVDANITLTPNAQNVLQPSVTLQLDADVNVTYTSVIPTGIHQILSLIYSIIGTHTSLVIDTIEPQLQDALNGLLRDDLHITYPPAFGPLTLAGVANSTEFVANDRGYVEQGLDAGIYNLINPYITQIDGTVKDELLTLRDEFKATFTDPVTKFGEVGLLGWAGTDFTNVARYYLGTVLSQNFINQYVYTIWLNGDFTYQFAGTELAELYSLLQQVYPALAAIPFEKMKIDAKLWPAVPPRTIFTPKPASEGRYYATTFFDDVRLCIALGVDPATTGVPTNLEFIFATQVFTEIGFGGLNTTTNQLDLLKIADRAFDVYFDLSGLGVEVIVPETQRFVQPGMTPSVSFDYSILDNARLQDLFTKAMLFSLAKRNKDAIPRGASDSQYTQRYPLGNDAVTAVFVLVPFQGNLYISHGLSGPATAIYEGALDIDKLDKTTARLILLFI